MRFRFFTYVLGAWALFTLSGCGDMIASLRQESRAVDEEAERDRENSDDAIRNYHPRTLTGLSANNVAEYTPPTARAYGRKLAGRAADLADDAGNDADQAYHRVTRDDFVDKAEHENSLWDGQGQSNYLFANNRRREPGDVITADVEKELRREIQYQLWMTLPPDQRRVKRAPASASDSVSNAAAGAAKDAAGSAAADAARRAGADKGLEAKAKDAAEEAAKTNMAPNGKDDDVVRMEVVENMGNGMMRVLGQKRVVYRGVSRVVEVAALVNAKDVDDGNHTRSSSFLDMKAQVIQ
jgi:flagellar basal body L-ring protein FlgH